MKTKSILSPMTILFLVLLTAGMLPVPTNAVAGTPHFTLKVPVKLYSLDARVSSLNVECLISKVSASALHPAAESNVLGRGRKDFTIPGNGNFTQTITVAVNIDSGKNPRAARSYMCTLKDQNYDIQWRARENSTGFQEKFRLKPGVPFIWRVRGNVRLNFTLPATRLR